MFRAYFMPNILHHQLNYSKCVINIYAQSRQMRLKDESNGRKVNGQPWGGGRGPGGLVGWEALPVARELAGRERSGVGFSLRSASGGNALM
eukprot:COSAG02_NODE_358_length_23882_cov_25.508683_21_plen_91_part_00